MTVGADLTALAHGFEAIGELPAPPDIDDGYWYARTTTLPQFSEAAAGDWRNGDHIAAMARFEVIVENSNKLVRKVDTAFNLDIRRS